jgi:hypothetical protein
VAIDPLLKQLITQSDRNESAVPLALFTACDRLSGNYCGVSFPKWWQVIPMLKKLFEQCCARN